MRKTLAALAIALAFTAPHPARAELAGCFNDPVLSLSNGGTLTLDTHDYGYLSQVTAVAYTVQLPTGVTITSITQDPSWTGPTPTVSSTSTLFPHVYTATVDVSDPSTPASQVDLAATATDSAGKDWRSSSGTTDSNVPIIHLQT